MFTHLVVSGGWQLRTFGFLLLVILFSAHTRITSGQSNNNVTPDNRNAATQDTNDKKAADGSRTPDQTPATNTTVKPADATQPGTQTSSNTPRVTEVKGTLALYHTISVKVDHLEELLKQADVEHKGLSQIVLHLDGYPLEGLPVRRVSVNGNDRDWLQYDLQRIDINKVNDRVNNAASWNSLLGRPQLFPTPQDRRVRVSVGLANNPIDTDYKDQKAYPLTVVNPIAYWIYIAGLIGLAIGFWYLAKKSDLLRDPGPDPPAEKDINGKEKPKKYKPYSLSRTQMAMWFLVIVASFVFIWMVTSNVTSLTATVLGLIGISAGTGLGSALIDSNKRGAIDKQKEDLDTEGKTLEVQIKELNSEIPATTDAAKLETLKASLAGKEERLAQVRKDLADLNAADKPLVSEGFFTDLLSDNNGVSFHRFQIFVWTIALIVIFIASVYNVLSMPEFDGTLLALMGISSGTYLGFKVPEPRTPPKDNLTSATTATTTTTASPDQKPGGETK